MFIGKKSGIGQERVTTNDRNSESIEATFSTFVDDMNDVLDQQNFTKIQRKCLEKMSIMKVHYHCQKTMRKRY